MKFTPIPISKEEAKRNCLDEAIKIAKIRADQGYLMRNHTQEILEDAAEIYRFVYQKTECIVTEVISKPYKDNGSWLVEVKYTTPEGSSQCTLRTHSKETAKKITTGYTFTE